MNTFKKVLEIVLLLAAIAVSVFPMFMYLAVVSDMLKFGPGKHAVQEVLLTITILAGFIGFFSMILRLIGILVQSSGRVVFISLILGCAHR